MVTKPELPPDLHALFEFTRARVTEKHIVDFSPGDPSSLAYVRVWTQILRSGEIPSKANFNLSEVIGLTGWDNAEWVVDSERFREYRRFTSAVALALLYQGNDPDCVRRPNYLARDLLVDCLPGESEYLNLLRIIFPIMRDRFALGNVEDEYPFFTFGSLILAQMANDYEESARWAYQLLADEAAVRDCARQGGWSSEDSRFLLGLTIFNQLDSDWKALASRLTNPSGDEYLQLVIEAFVKAAN